MRFAVSPNLRTIQELVVALDRANVPMAQTWREVGEAASRLGLRRPGYHLVRQLALVERARRAAHRETMKAAAGVVLATGSPYALRVLEAFDDLELARAREALVLSQHKRLFVPP